VSKGIEGLVMHNLVRIAVVTMALAAWMETGPARAASELVETVQARLYAGETSAAAAAAEARLATNPEDDEARFALGAVEFLQAVENLGRSFHRYGLVNGDRSAALTGLPFFRLPIPTNPNPEKIDYEKLRGVLIALVGDLAKAEATLAGIHGEAIDLPINLGLVRFDFDGDGKGSEEETLARVLERIMQGSLNADPADPILVDFDASDVPWLRAYCHLLSAFAEFPLAYDWHVAFEATFQGLFPSAGLPISQFEHLPLAPEAQWFPPAADLIAFIHLLHWPVAEPVRLQSVLAHLEAMPPLSRENWRRIEAETDSKKEWLPNPHQTGVFPHTAVTQEQIDGWLMLLDEYEAVLQGRKLLPHWRFAKGINLRRLFLEPTTFDLVLLIQGSAAIPYLEDGELTEGDTWRRIGELLGGDFFGYALWFN
jgi:hypothetical protein